MIPETAMKIGQRFVVRKIEFEILAVEAGRIRYAEVKGGRIRHMAFAKFKELRDRNIAELIGEKLNENDLQRPSKLTEVEMTEMNRRLSYVRPITKAMVARSHEYVEPLIINLAKERKEDPPGTSTVLRWIRKYILANENPLSLAPRFRDRGNRSLRFDPRVEGIMSDRIAQDYLNSQRLSVARVSSHIVGHLMEEFGDNDMPPVDLTFPSERTVQRRVAEIDLYKRDRARFGPHAANRRHKAAGAQRVVTRVLEVTEADGTLLDVLIVDPDTGDVLGRPYCTAVIDVWSRAIIALVITFTPFSAPTLLMALKMACSQKCTQNMGGVMEVVVFDNGSDYGSDAVRNFCSRTGIQIETCAPRDPNGKPHIERFFKTMNHQLIHILKGTTFSNPTDRGDYLSNKYACVTMEVLRSRVFEWLENDYHIRLHRGFGRTPFHAWEESAKDHLPLVFPVDDLDIIARSVVLRSINRGRIQYENQHWYSHALAMLEQQLGTHGLPDKVKVFVDELNLDRVFVEDPRSHGNFIQADSTRPEYTRGLTLYEHRKVCQEIRDQGKADLEKLPPFAWEKARWELWKKIVEDGESYANKQIALLTDGKKKRLLDTDEKIMKQTEELPEPPDTLGDPPDDGKNEASIVETRENRYRRQKSDTDPIDIVETSKNSAPEKRSFEVQRIIRDPNK
ncbi:MAG: DDE-type integrase/transposase/recombinase [Acidithiobacillus sp.]